MAVLGKDPAECAGGSLLSRYRHFVRRDDLDRELSTDGADLGLARSVTRGRWWLD
ncbi:hypothetical protein [Ensifer sp. BR816]|uniref:hypothetical protein n=1 Tax=Rhizobium sp. (strain BR816) TaxID=1057002 RepID=UPI0012FAA008|nr:hypothetical protein [Ensifer sp. BR816]